MPKKKIVSKCGFKQSKDNANLFSVAFNNLTKGEIYSLINALRIARKISPVAEDLSSYLSNAFYSADDSQAKKEFSSELAEEIDVELVNTNNLTPSEKELFDSWFNKG